jgi:hypothetical protein
MSSITTELPSIDDFAVDVADPSISFPTNACCPGCPLKNALIYLRWRSISWESYFKRAKLRETALKEKVEDLQARITYLERQLYATKSEQHFASESCSQEKKVVRSRGQQLGSKGHGRREHAQLPIREQIVSLDSLSVTSTFFA